MLAPISEYTKEEHRLCCYVFRIRRAAGPQEDLILQTISANSRTQRDVFSIYLGFHILSILLPLIMYPASQKTLSLMKFSFLITSIIII